MIKHNIIVVGTSAGGVQTLCELTKYLPEDFDASIFVVMHIGSETMLPEILSRRGSVPAVTARTRQRIQTRSYLLRSGKLPPFD
jgi:two-component system chemotaxis response regulator CheB